MHSIRNVMVMRGKACTLFWNVNAWFEDHFLKPPSQSSFENPKSVLQRLKIFWYLKGFSHAACYVNIFGILLFSSPLIFMYFPWPSSLSLWHGMVHWWQLSVCYQYNGNKVSWVQISSQAAQTGFSLHVVPVEKGRLLCRGCWLRI